VITESGLLVQGDRLVRLDEYIVIDGQGRGADYHSRVTFEAPSEIAGAEYAYHSGSFQMGPSVLLIQGSAAAQGVSHRMGISRASICFDPPVPAGGIAEVGVEAYIVHQVPLMQVFRFSGERGVDEFMLDVFFCGDHLPKEIWQVQLSAEGVEPTDRTEQPVELREADKSDPDDHDYCASVELSHVPPRRAIGLRWVW
jgi:hypothetical protein